MSAMKLFAMRKQLKLISKPRGRHTHAHNALIHRNISSKHIFNLRSYLLFPQAQVFCLTDNISSSLLILLFTSYSFLFILFNPKPPKWLSTMPAEISQEIKKQLWNIIKAKLNISKAFFNISWMALLPDDWNQLESIVNVFFPPQHKSKPN